MEEASRPIKERDQAEGALRRSEERFRKIFDHSNDAIFVIDPAQDKILDVNSTACDMLGYSRNELLSTPISAIHPNEMPQLLAFAESVVERGSGWTDELTCLTKSGETLPAEISASVFEVGGTRCVLALVRNIAERKRAEKALRESEERLASIVGSAMDAIVTITEDRTVRLFNAAAEDVFGCSSADVVGQSFDRFAPEALRELVARSVEAFGRSGTGKRYLWAPDGITATRADGEEFPIEATISQAEAAGQKLYTVILRDVNDRTRAEEEFSRLQIANVYLREEVGAEYEVEEIICTATAMRKVLESVERVAGTDSTVLVTGETGTGKELIARAIHKHSERKGELLVTVNCAALPGGLIESELFGHEKGAFTGALSRKIGRFEMADRGTIFLDEIGDLPMELQAKLLRVLQEGEFERVGGAETFKVDVRVIAATNHDLQKAMEEQRFRADLYYRLNVFPICIPPLREHRDDIPLLVTHFAMKYATKMGKKIDTIPKATMNALVAYAWPGNVRELQNIIERAVILSQGAHLTLGDWLPKPSASPSGTRVLSLDELERRHITDVLEMTGWRVSGDNGAASILDIKPTTLEARMKKLGIKRRGT